MRALLARSPTEAQLQASGIFSTPQLSLFFALVNVGAIFGAWTSQQPAQRPLKLGMPGSAGHAWLGAPSTPARAPETLKCNYVELSLGK